MGEALGKARPYIGTIGRSLTAASPEAWQRYGYGRYWMERPEIEREEAARQAAALQFKLLQTTGGRPSPGAVAAMEKAGVVWPKERIPRTIEAPTEDKMPPLQIALPPQEVPRAIPSPAELTAQERLADLYRIAITQAGQMERTKFVQNEIAKRLAYSAERQKEAANLLAKRRERRMHLAARLEANAPMWFYDSEAKKYIRKPGSAYTEGVDIPISAAPTPPEIPASTLTGVANMLIRAAEQSNLEMLMKKPSKTLPAARESAKTILKRGGLKDEFIEDFISQWEILGKSMRTLTPEQLEEFARTGKMPGTPTTEPGPGELEDWALEKQRYLGELE